MKGEATPWAAERPLRSGLRYEVEETGVVGPGGGSMDEEGAPVKGVKGAAPVLLMPGGATYLQGRNL